MTHLIKCLLLLPILLSPNAVMAWPWGDSSKYKNECHQACIEDSFGKAGVREIQMRCANKCDHLPLSPKDQWRHYDECAPRLDRLHKEMLDEKKRRDDASANCEKLLQSRLKKCDAVHWSLEESCRFSAKQSLPGDCFLSATNTIYDSVAATCKKPSVSRPN